MHRLRPNGAVPELLEAAGCVGPGGGVDAAAGMRAVEKGAEGAEDAGTGAEGHGGRARWRFGGRAHCNSGRSQKNG